MENFEKEILANMVIAPYIQKATALCGVRRHVGGNQFRHAFATLAILIDYHYTDAVLLKASLLHDLVEDVKSSSADEIRVIDSDGPRVLDLILEVTKRKEESKENYQKRILNEGSANAKILRCAERVSNLTDLHPDIFEKEYIKTMIYDTRRWILPMAEEVNKDMAYELSDLVKRREQNLRFSSMIWPMRRIE